MSESKLIELGYYCKSRRASRYGQTRNDHCPA